MFETATLSIFKDIKVHMKINNCIDLFNANANDINYVCIVWMFNFKQLTDIQLRACQDIFFVVCCSLIFCILPAKTGLVFQIVQRTEQLIFSSERDF